MDYTHPHPDPLPQERENSTPRPSNEDRPAINPRTGRLRVADVKRIHDAVGGDPVTEEMILTFVSAKYGARNLLHLAPKVATEILRRPVEFIRAAKRHGEPELNF